jgi:hypothetical protein
LQVDQSHPIIHIWFLGLMFEYKEGSVDKETNIKTSPRVENHWIN